MIVETLVDLFLEVIINAFETFQFFSLPLDFISVLSTILAYGNWVVGVDVMALFAGSVVFWWVFHMSIGLIVWVWNKLPLT